MTRWRKLGERPAVDWLLIFLLAGAASLSPLRALFTCANADAQRGTMTSTGAVLGTVAAFAIAALFFYAGLDNPATRRVRSAWGGLLSRSFLGALAVIILAALVCGFTGLAVPSTGATVVFFASVVAAVVKLGRLTVVVAALLRGQRYDGREKPNLQVT